MKRTSSYLNACIMHRYFNRVRLQALRLMRKSYTVGGQVELYPTHSLIRQLGLDDFEQMRAFCEKLDIAINEEDISIKRERAEDHALGSSLPLMRARQLVELKRVTTIGEVVNNGPLPPNPYKQFPLHNSFDMRGNLKETAKSADDQRSKSEFLSQEQGFMRSVNIPIPTFSSTPSIFGQLALPLPPKPVKKQFTDKDLHNVAMPIALAIYNAVMQDEIRDTAEETVVRAKKSKIMQDAMASTFHSLLKEIVEVTTHQVPVLSSVRIALAGRACRCAMQRMSIGVPVCPESTRRSKHWMPIAWNGEG